MCVSEADSLAGQKVEGKRGAFRACRLPESLQEMEDRALTQKCKRSYSQALVWSGGKGLGAGLGFVWPVLGALPLLCMRAVFRANPWGPNFIPAPAFWAGSCPSLVALERVLAPGAQTGKTLGGGCTGQNLYLHGASCSPS